MLVHPQFDPIAIQLGPVAIHWYGLMYLVAFALFVVLARQRLKLPHFQSAQPAAWRPQDVEDVLFLGVLGAILGGRLGYVLFYKFSYYASHPLEILAVWQGGMSFHGGFLGVLLATMWFAHSRGRRWLDVTDFIAPCVPTGLAAGRLGNFINGELWGRVSDPQLPWGMVFAGAGPAPRHPSQLYQFALEGLLLFVILWVYSKKPRATGAVSAVFLVGYGAFRFVAEYFREPDDFLGLLSLGWSMGQWLSAPMVLVGLALWWWSARRQMALERAAR